MTRSSTPTLTPRIRRPRRFMTTCGRTDVDRLYGPQNTPISLYEVIDTAAGLEWLYSVLDDVEYSLLVYRLGLQGVQPHDIPATAAHHRTDFETADRIIRDAGTKLFRQATRLNPEAEHYGLGLIVFNFPEGFFGRYDANQGGNGHVYNFLRMPMAEFDIRFARNRRLRQTVKNRVTDFLRLRRERLIEQDLRASARS